MSAKFTPPTHSSHYQLALPPSSAGHRVACSLVVCPGGQLFCLKLTQRHTQRYKRRNGGYEEPIPEPWNRPGLTGVKATCPACQISKEVMSRYPHCYWWVQWHPCWTACNTIGTGLKNILHFIHSAAQQVNKNVTLPSIGDVFSRLQSPWTSP